MRPHSSRHGGQPAVSWVAAKGACLVNPPLAQREAKTGHPRTAYARIRDVICGLELLPAHGLASGRHRVQGP